MARAEDSKKHPLGLHSPNRALGLTQQASSLLPPTLSTYTGAGTGAFIFNHPRLSEGGNKD